MAFFNLRRNQLRVPTILLLVLNVVFASVSLTLCLAVTLDQAVHRIVWLAIVVPTIVMVFLIGKRRRRLTPWEIFPTLILIALAIALVSGRAIRKHDFISSFPDAWAYCSFAEYVEHNAH
jgi:uncharacterized membrane protein YjdF